MRTLKLSGPLARVGLFFGLALLLQGCVLFETKKGGPWGMQPALTLEERSKLPDPSVRKSHVISLKQGYPSFRFWEDDTAEVGGVPVNAGFLDLYMKESGRPDLAKRFDKATWLRRAGEWGMGSALIFFASAQGAKEPSLRSGLNIAGVGAVLGALPLDVWGALKRDSAVASFNDWLAAVPPLSATAAVLPEAPAAPLPPPKNRDELFYRTYRLQLNPFRIGGISYREELIGPYLNRVQRKDLMHPIEQAQDLGSVAKGFLAIGILGTLWSCNQALPQNGVPTASQDWPAIQSVFWSSLGSLTLGLGLRAVEKSWVGKIETDYNNGLKMKYKLQF
jgi:hypothetical protein